MASFSELYLQYGLYNRPPNLHGATRELIARAYATISTLLEKRSSAVMGDFSPDAVAEADIMRIAPELRYELDDVIMALRLLIDTRTRELLTGAPARFPPRNFSLSQIFTPITELSDRLSRL